MTYLNNECISQKNEEFEPDLPVEMNTTQSNTYRKDLDWLHFNNNPMVQEKQQVQHQQSFKPMSVV